MCSTSNVSRSPVDTDDTVRINCLLTPGFLVLKNPANEALPLWAWGEERGREGTRPRAIMASKTHPGLRPGNMMRLMRWIG